MSDEKIDYIEVRGMLTQIRSGLDIALPGITQITTELLTIIDQLLDENEELRDKAWATDRQVHAHDPWEAEDA